MTTTSTIRKSIVFVVIIFEGFSLLIQVQVQVPLARGLSSSRRQLVQVVAYYR